MERAKRPYGFWTAAAMVIGGVIGAGIFVVPSSFAGLGWSGVGAWIAGSVGAVIVGTVLSALVVANPDEPGIIATIGHVLGPVVGVLVGWGAWVSYWCANAYIALTAARYAGQVVPGLAATPLRQALTACALIAALTLLNLGGLKASGRFNVVTTILKLLPLVAVVVIVATLGATRPAAFALATQPALAAAPLLTATALAMAAIIGFEAPSIAAARIRDPARIIPRATIAGIAVCCLLYIVVCVGIAFAMPPAQLAASNAPVALFVGLHWGAGAANAVAAFAVVSTVGCLNVWVLLQGEVPLGLVRGGLLPGWFARTSARDIAVTPMVLASALSMALLLLGSWHAGAAIMDFMLRLTVVSGVWIYALAGLAAMKARVRPVLGALATLFSFGVMAGSGAEAVVLSVALMLAALPLYALARRDQRRTRLASGTAQQARA